MIIRKKSKRTDYSQLGGAAEIAKARRRDKKVKEDVQKIDKQTAGIESALENTLGSVSKKEVRKRQQAAREKGNTTKLNRLLKW